MAAAVEAFQAWAAGQGSVRTEHEQILANVSDFIGRHGDSRFGSVNADPDHPGHAVHNRAGWWREDSQGRAYLFTTGGLTEALGGFDLKRGLDALEAAGWIVEREANARSVRVRVNGGRPRLFAIRPTDGEEEAA